MSEKPYMQLYVSDYIGDTMHLSTEQHGAYLLLLMAMWNAGGRLPNDKRKLSYITRVAACRWHLVWPEISNFFVIEGTEIINRRLEREHQKWLSLRAERKRSGAIGGRAKALKDKEARLANATVLPQHLHIPYTIKKEVKKNTASRGTRLPEDWQPDADTTIWAMTTFGWDKKKGLEVEEVFRDYWHSESGQRASKLDWDKTFKNWCRREGKQRKPNGSGKESLVATTLRMIEQEEQKDANRDENGIIETDFGNLLNLPKPH